MAGMGPAPKPASTRRRTNRTSTAAVIRRDPSVRAPKLPPHPGVNEGETWHPMTQAWWKDIWHSPMAGEFDDSDKHGLFALACLVDDFWTAPSSRARSEAASEIRLQGQRFGLSPIDRRRLQWEIEHTEEAQQRGARRRQTAEPKPAVPQDRPADPRGVLRSVQ